MLHTLLASFMRGFLWRSLRETYSTFFSRPLPAPGWPGPRGSHAERVLGLCNGPWVHFLLCSGIPLPRHADTLLRHWRWAWNSVSHWRGNWPEGRLLLPKTPNWWRRSHTPNRRGCAWLLGQGMRIMTVGMWRDLGEESEAASRDSTWVFWGMWEKISGWRGASEQGTHRGRQKWENWHEVGRFHMWSGYWNTN